MAEQVELLAVELLALGQLDHLREQRRCRQSSLWVSPVKSVLEVLDNGLPVREQLGREHMRDQRLRRLLRRHPSRQRRPGLGRLGLRLSLDLGLLLLLERMLRLVRPVSWEEVVELEPFLEEEALVGTRLGLLALEDVVVERDALVGRQVGLELLQYLLLHLLLLRLLRRGHHPSSRTGEGRGGGSARAETGQRGLGRLGFRE